jgi:hypothetical protein
MMRVGIGILTLAVAFVVTGRGQTRTNGAIARRGVALTPANFPRHSRQDVENMFTLGGEVGSVSVFIYQWSQPDLLDVARKMMRASRAAGLVPIVALSPTTLGGMRGALDVPPQVRRAAGRRLSFAEKPVHETYIRDALALAKLKPPYLCLATEINLLAIANLKEYLTFAHVYKQVYPLIKKTSPDTKVFVSFQWDVIRMMGVKEPNRIGEHAKQIEVFRPELDAVAFTSYPADSFETPARLPAGYYEGSLQHVQSNEEIMFMEIGWPSTGKGTEQEQVEFIQSLPALMAKVKPSVLAWALLHDVRGSGLGADLASTGLADPAGRRKAAFEAFKQLR